MGKPKALKPAEGLVVQVSVSSGEAAKRKAAAEASIGKIMNKYMNTSVCVCVYVYIYMCVWVRVRVRVSIHTHIYMYLLIHMYAYKSD